MLRALIILALLSPVGPAGAGPWTQDPGEGLAVISAYPGANAAPSYTGLYAEYGLAPRLTAGIDVGRAASGSTRSVAFLRRALRVPGPPALAVSAEIGLGRIARQAVLRPGVSLGYGLNGKLGTGWLALDTMAEVGLTRRTLDLKTDVTLGLRPRDGLQAIVQVQTGQSAGDPPFARLVPSLVMRLRSGTQLELGLTHSLRGPRATGARIALWRRF